jgi:hypothetical protein
MHTIAVRFRQFLWLLVFAVGPLAQAAPLLDPEPVLIPAGLSESSVAKAIRLGSAKRSWMITKDEPGRMEATLHVRTHTVKVAIPYGVRDLHIQYLSSENMEFEQKKGQQHIHKNYNKWVRNLAVDISAQLAQMPPDAK